MCETKATGNRKSTHSLKLLIPFALPTKLMLMINSEFQFLLKYDVRLSIVSTSSKTLPFLKGAMLSI